MLLDHRATASSRLSMGSTNKLKIGIFGCNLNSGKNATTVPERWSGSWDDNVRLAQMADEYGLEFFLPLGRWAAGAAGAARRTIRSRASKRSRGLRRCSH